MAVVTVSDFDTNKMPFTSKVDKKNLIECESTQGKYTLLNCDCYGETIYPEYVVKGTYDFTFDTVVVSIHGLSTWFNNNSRYELDECGLAKKFDLDKFCEVVTYGQHKYEIQNKHSCVISHKGEKNYLVSEKDTIQIKCLSKTLSLDEAKHLAWKIKILVSILSGEALSFENIWIVNNSTKQYNSIYYSDFTYLKEPFSSRFDLFCTARYLFSENLWETVLTNFFENDHFEKLWPQLYSIFSYEGSWHFDFMNHVILLDRYCSLIADKRNFKGLKWDNEALKLQLEQEIELFAKNGTDKRKTVKHIISHIKASKIPPFKQKYEFTMNFISNDVKEMIAFKEDDFDLMKAIRDQAAHGSEVKTKESKSISYEVIVKNRLLVLLMYLSFNELGFKQQHFAVCLDRTLKKFVRSANFNKKEKDRLAGNVPFIPLSHDFNKDKYPRSRFYVVLKHNRKDNSYYIDDPVSALTDSWPASKELKKYKDVKELVKDKVEDKDFSDCEFVNRVYLCVGNGDEYLCNAVIIISYN